MTAAEPTLEWVRWQIRRLVEERRLVGLSAERAAKYVDLCAQERCLLALRDGVIPPHSSALASHPGDGQEPITDPSAPYPAAS